MSNVENENTPTPAFATGERLGLLTTGVAGDGGWVDVKEPIIVRAGDALIAVLVEPSNA